jgi:cytochrome P450
MSASPYCARRVLQHRDWRRSLQEHFTRQAVQSFGPVIVEVLGGHFARWPREGKLNVYVSLQDACVEMSAQLVFGPEIAGALPQLVHLVRRGHHFAARDLRAWPDWPAWVPLHRRRCLAALERELAHTLAPLIAVRRAGALGNDLLSVLVRSSPDGPDRASEHTLRNQALMLFVAGFEPVSGTLAWALRLLAEHSQLQDEVASEVLAEIGASGPTAADLPRLGFTSQVVEEALRLYPNEWMLTRRAAGADRLPCGLSVLPGEEVLISPYLLHRDERFFPHPDRFDPSRFAPGNAVPRDAYMPFGTGPRVCLGASLAVLAVTLGLALVLRRWRVAPGTLARPRLESVNLFSSQPRDGEVWLELAPRPPQ